MANVEIIVKAIDQTKAGFSAAANNIKGVGDSAEIAAKKNAILGTVVSATTALIVDSYNSYSKLSESIRDLSLVSGESAESTSRFIQVLDDYQITAGDAETAAKKLKDNGLSPTIDTLAMLSDQFRGIQDPAERLDFVYDKLGKSGTKFINMLNQGGDAIRANADAISESLILNEMEIKMYEVGRLAIDEKRDAVEAFRVELGQSVGNVIAFASAMERANEIQQESTVVVNGQKKSTIEYGDALNMAIAEQLQAADASAEYKHSLEEQEAATKAAEKALKELSATNADIINGAINLTKENENYQKSQDDVLAKIAETRAEGEKLYPWEHEKILENKQALEELGQQYFDNVEKQKAAQAESLAMMAIEKIAMSDGVAGYSDAEREKAIAILTTQDVATAAAFEQQQAMEDLTNAVADGRVSVEDYARIWEEASADGVISIGEVSAAIEAVPTSKTVTFDIVTNGAPPNLDTSTSAANAPRGTHRTTRARGGDVWAGSTYMVNEEGQEMFTPSQNGYITPKERIGQTQSSGITRQDLDYLIEGFALAITSAKTNEPALAREIVSAMQQGVK